MKLRSASWRAWASRRMRPVALWTAALGALLVPIPLAAWGAIVMAAGVTPAHPLTAAWPIIAANARTWLGTAGYLPWHTWPILIGRGLLSGWMLGTGGVAVWLTILAVMVGHPAIEGDEYGGPPAAGRGEHGTARWRTPVELATTFHIWTSGDEATGLLLGKGPEPGTAYIDTSEEHELLLGATGSGKSRSVIIPTIGVIGSARQSSLLMTDPKGELYAHTAEWLRKQGYEIVRFDLREPSRSARWNPLLAVTEALAAGRRDQASSIAWDTAGEPPGNPRIANEAPWTWPTPEERHMASVYATLQGTRLDDLFNQFPHNHPAYKAYRPTKRAKDAEKTLAGIMLTASAALRLFADDEMAYLVGAQDHDLAAPGSKLTATFLVIPDERTTRYPLATLYIQQTLQALAALADQHGGKLQVPMTCLLDEFGNLPAIKDFDKTVTVARSRGIRLLLAVQDLAQLKRHYGDASHTIQGNMGLWLYLLTADPETAKIISDKLGTYTVPSSTLSVPRVSMWTRAAPAGQPSPITASTTGTLGSRQLLTPDEVTRWPRGKSLILQARQLPAKLPLPDLSVWSDAWPDIQERKPEPEPNTIAAPPTWEPPEEEESGAEESVKKARRTSRHRGAETETSGQTVIVKPPDAAGVGAGQGSGGADSGDYDDQ